MSKYLRYFAQHGNMETSVKMSGETQLLKDTNPLRLQPSADTVTAQTELM